MNKDLSFERIDITKLLLWICILLICIFAIWTIFIIPDSNSLRLKTDALAKNRAKLSKLESLQADLNAQIQQIKSINAKELLALSNTFDERKFLNFAKSFFQDAKLEESFNQNDQYRLLVSAKINSPSSFYEFLQSLSSYSNILKVDFPIVMKTEGDLIKAQFNIKLFKDPSLKLD